MSESTEMEEKQSLTKVLLLMNLCDRGIIHRRIPRGSSRSHSFPSELYIKLSAIRSRHNFCIENLYKREMLAEFVEAYGKYEELQRLASKVAIFLN